MYAEVIIDISSDKLDRGFSYRVPEELVPRVQIGMVVNVPFGKGNQLRQGYVIGLSDEAGYAEDKVKEIRGIAIDSETNESRLIALADWLRGNYGGTMLQALKTVLPIREKVRAKENRKVILTADPETAEDELAFLRGTRYKARTRLLEGLLASEDGSLSLQEARALGMNASVAGYFVQKDMIRLDSREALRLSLDPSDYERLPEAALSESQEEAAAKIREEWRREAPRPVLLHGVTGSGKTEVYMKLIEEVLAEGREVIVLIPEISLTYQTVRRFYGRFGDQVSVLNSRLSQGERYDQFKRAKRGDIRIMVGPRSALFTPFTRLGLIIMDEEHEPAYKSESTPRYHARETAVERARMEGARVVLGSATPSLEAYSRAEAGEYLLVSLEGRYEERPLPRVHIADLREELKSGNRSILSRALRAELEQCLRAKEQAMLFLNRRGYAGFVSCRTCGHVMKCPHCEVSLSQHNNGTLVCHYCGFTMPMPSGCPECGSTYIGGFKAGTQQVEQVLKRTFPEARVLRMDSDTTRTKGSYEQILSAFAAHEADILLGTQMIVKGHDFPDVTLVGVLAADLSLYASDYHSAERTFQLLTQAVGRSGRGRNPGRAVIQTYHPEHYSIRAAVSQDYRAFYEEEYSYRMLMSYPPTGHMLAVLGASEDEDLLTEGMGHIAALVGRIGVRPEPGLIGPAPEAVGRIRDQYRQVLYLKHPQHEALVHIKDIVERYVEINSGFRRILIQVDLV
ncbi:MAG: primosomal protein N' [Blautia sp.]|nr:primosomal protein N' [Blautia sp.]